MSKILCLATMLALVVLSSSVLSSGAIADSDKYLIDKIAAKTTDTSIIVILVRDILDDVKQIVGAIQKTLDLVAIKMDASMSILSNIDGSTAQIRNHTGTIHKNTHDILEKMHTISGSSIEANARAGLLTTQSDTILQRIDALETSVNELSERVLESGRRSAALESLILHLPTVSESLNEIPLVDNMPVQEMPETISEQEAKNQEERRDAVPGSLRQGHSAQTVTAYHFKQYGDLHKDTYTLNLEISCNRDIFVDQVYAQNRHDITKNQDNANTLYANDEMIYHSQLQISGHPYDVRLDMHLEQLSATNPFKITLTQTDSDGMIQGSSISKNTDIVDIHAIWYTVYDGTACPVLFDGQSGFDGKLVQSGQISWGVTVPKQGLLNDFASVLHCQNSPVTITAVHAAVPDWPPTLSGYGNLRLSVPNSEYLDYVISFENDGTIRQITNYTYAGHDLTVSGSLPVADTAVLKLEYVTAANTLCTILP